MLFGPQTNNMPFKFKVIVLLLQVAGQKDQEEEGEMSRLEDY